MGWPVVTLQRFTGISDQPLKKKDFSGNWEIIILNDLEEQSTPEQGQIPPVGWTYNKKAFNLST